MNALCDTCAELNAHLIEICKSQRLKDGLILLKGKSEYLLLEM